jgi:RHS repeat-associated protein
MPPAARRTDPVEHGLGMLGMLAGMIAGAILVSVLAAGTIASGGLLAAALVGGAIAGGGLAGEKIAQGIGTIMHISGIVTGDILMPTSSDVFIGYLSAARAKIDGGPCNGLFFVNHPPMPMALIAQGSDSVNINYLPAARVGDKLVCAADILKGEDTVIIGGGTVTVLPIFDTEAIMHTVLVGIGLLSAVVGLGALAVGVVTGAVCVTAAVNTLAVAGATMLASQAAHQLGDMIGPGWGDVFEGVTDFAGMAVGMRALDGEPVDVVTGEICVKAVDFELPGTLPIRLERAYASSLDQESWLGPNWCSTWGQSVVDTGAGVVHYIPGDGRKIPLDLNRADQYGWIRNPTVNKVRLRDLGWGFEVINEANLQLRFEYLRGRESLLTSIQDQNGNAIRFHYDDDGTLRGVIHSGGYRLHVDGSATRVTSIALEQPDGSLALLVRYEYDGAGRLSGIDNGSGKLLLYEYDQDARITRWADRQDSWYEYNYDEHGRCAEAIGPAGMYHYRFVYNTAGRTTSTIDSYGAVKVFRYNRQRRLVEQRDPLGGVSLTEWDERGNRLSVTDPENRGVDYSYDSDGNLISAVDALGRATLIQYNQSGLPVLMIDPAQRRWFRKYDVRGNLIESGLEGAAPWRYERDASGNAIRVIDPSGRSRQFTYNQAGLPVAVSDWEGNVTHYERDSFGRIVRETDPLDSETRFSYNSLGKLAQVSLQDGARVRWNYDVEGNLTQWVGPDGSTYSYEYGPFDLLQSLSRPSGTGLTLQYDKEARLTAVENERAERWTYKYDLAGRLVEEVDFTGRSNSFEYDGSGLLARWVNGNDEATVYERNKGGQIVTRRSTDGSRASFEYDPNGLVIAATNESCAVKLDRDDYGRVFREVQGDRVAESSFDDRGLRIRRSTRNGQAVEWTYDDNGRVSRVALPGDEWLEFTRDATGRNIERRMRGGFVLRQTFDSVDRLTSQWAGVRAGTSTAAAAIADRQYRYDSSDRLTELDDGPWGNSKYLYNVDGRLKGITRNRGSSQEFSYDSGGNINGVLNSPSGLDSELDPVAARSQARFIGKGGRLEQSGETRYFYDKEGRVTEKHEPGGIWRYQWTTAGLLQRVITPSGRAWSYEYDAFDRRVRKKGPDATTTYIWDGPVIAEEIQETRSASTAATWIFEPGTFRPVAKIEGGTSYACVTDHIGTPRELVSGNGDLAWSAQLRAWGEIEEQGADETDCKIRFQGQWWDDESGLAYNFYRYYEPATGVYMSSDPLGLDGGSRIYGYVHNPLGWVDPLGLGSCKSWNEFQARNKGVDFSSRSEASDAWYAYKQANQSPNDLSIGRLPETAAAKAAGRQILDMPPDRTWTPNVNDSWVQGGIDRGANFNMESPPTPANRYNPPGSRYPETVYGRELSQLEGQGYTPSGGQMVPPGKGP